MATTYTSSLRLTNQQKGANPDTWGDIADTNFEHIDDAIAGMTSIDFTTGDDQVLTANQGADDTSRYAALWLHGTPTGAATVSIPAVEKSYMVINQATSATGGITIRTGGTGGVTFTSADPNGLIYCNGVSVYMIGNINTSTTDLIAANNLSDLDDPEVAVSNLFVNRPWVTSASSLGWALSVCATDNELEVKATTILSAVYPVGSIYMNRTNSANPNTIFGFGTWTAVASARVLIGVGTGSDDNAVNYTVTAESARGEYEHVLTTGELARHAHTYLQTSGSAGDANGGIGIRDLKYGSSNTGYTGNDEAHNNVQPWFSVYIWERTA
jgi:hypothetical protein